MDGLFFKYQSLGNDFIVFDWYNESVGSTAVLLNNESWSTYVALLCDRHTGIGADGILVLTKDDDVPEMRIFNADGSAAQSCLNGLRCVAQHLITRHSFSGLFSVKMGSKLVKCEPIEDVVEMVIPQVTYLNPHELVFSQGVLQGHQADAGNHHFIVFEEKVKPWLEVYGKELESHKDFPRKANISFVWPVPQERGFYYLLTFERGCGITQACSSAAAAVLKTLYALKQIQIDEPISLQMLGGSVVGFVTHDGHVVLQAGVKKVFQGIL